MPKVFWSSGSTLDIYIYRIILNYKLNKYLKIYTNTIYKTYINKNLYKIYNFSIVKFLYFKKY